MEIPMLQMDPPRRSDGRCIIAGNRSALLLLQHAATVALAGGHGQCHLAAPDGEALQLHVLQLTNIGNLHVNYAGEAAVERSLREQFTLEDALRQVRHDAART